MNERRHCRPCPGEIRVGADAAIPCPGVEPVAPEWMTPHHAEQVRALAPPAYVPSEEDAALVDRAADSAEMTFTTQTGGGGRGAGPLATKLRALAARMRGK